MNEHVLAQRARFSNPFASPGLRSRHNVWYQTTIAMLALLALCIGLSLFDDRVLIGVSVWTKPIKFSLSLVAYFATMAWFAPLLPHGYFRTLPGRLLTWVPVICAMMEMIYIVYQAALGEASHFNVSTPVNAMMYSLMGTGATLIVASTLWMGLVILHQHRLRDPMALAVGLGFVATFLLGGGFGAYLGSNGGHWVGGAASDANGLWVVKWARDGGDLRVAHFFGMHAMQMLPLTAAMLPASWTRARANATVFFVLGFYASFTAWTFIQAVQGRPFLP